MVPGTGQSFQQILHRTFRIIDEGPLCNLHFLVIRNYVNWNWNLDLQWLLELFCRNFSRSWATFFRKFCGKTLERTAQVRGWPQKPPLKRGPYQKRQRCHTCHDNPGLGKSVIQSVSSQINLLAHFSWRQFCHYLKLSPWLSVFVTIFPLLYIGSTNMYTNITSHSPSLQITRRYMFTHDKKL